MSMVNIRNPIRCFCSYPVKRTDDNIFVCGRYKSGEMVCLFHLHDENVENYYQSNGFPMSLDCEMCLATIKIHSKQYIAPCRLTFIRCYCNAVASFGQSQRNNSNNGNYFFGCPNWRIKKCEFFSWAHEYKTTLNAQILNGLTIPSLTENQTDENNQSRKRNLDTDDDIDFKMANKKHEELRRRFECVICWSEERSHLISPCNHLCCCGKCVGQIQHQCPMCRGRIESIKRIFCV